MFEELCDKFALRNVILTTTMWDAVDEHVGLRRQKELEEVYWKGMIDAGYKAARYLNTTESAWDILDHCFQAAKQCAAPELPSPAISSPIKTGIKIFFDLFARRVRQVKAEDISNQGIIIMCVPCPTYAAAFSLMTPV